jgi:hypothetical protein
LLLAQPYSREQTKTDHWLDAFSLENYFERKERPARRRLSDASALVRQMKFEYAI